MTSDIVRSALSHIWNALGTHGYDRAVMGGMALAAWSHPRATRDIDLLIDLSRNDIDRLVAQLAPSGLRPKKSPPLNVVGEHAFLQFLYTPPNAFYDVQLDLMLAESEFQKSAIRRSVPREVPGIEGSIHILSCEDLLLFKLVAGRLIDQADAATLLRENRATLDESHLASWLTRLKLSAQIGVVWGEAFPAEPCPF